MNFEIMRGNVQFFLIAPAFVTLDLENTSTAATTCLGKHGTGGNDCTGSVQSNHTWQEETLCWEVHRGSTESRTMAAHKQRPGLSTAFCYLDHLPRV